MRLAPLVLLLLLLSSGACTRTVSFTAKIEGLDQARTRDALGLECLKLSTQSTGGQPWSLEFSTDEHTGGPGLAPLKFGDLHLKALATTDYWVINRITAGDRTLSPSDLRVNHDIRVSHGKFDVEKVNEASLDILNYSVPSKALRLAISVDSPPNPKSLPSDILELIVVSHLSWRLPPEFRILKPSELSASASVLGDLNVRYRVVKSDSGYAIRSTSTIVELEIDVKLSHSNLSTNWAKLRLRGGASPRGTEMHDYSYQSALGQVPPFELR